VSLRDGLTVDGASEGTARVVTDVRYIGHFCSKAF